MSEEKGVLTPKKESKPLKYYARSKVKLMHHLFKGSVEKFLRNNSWKKGMVEIDGIEHTHYFHTINSMGMEQKYTAAVGGHFHEVTVVKNAKGEITEAICGPALKKVIKKTPSGISKTTYAPIKYMDKENDREVVDDHKHVLEYKGSDEIIPNKVQNAIQMPQLGNTFENNEVRLDVLE